PTPAPPTKAPTQAKPPAPAPAQAQPQGQAKPAPAPAAAQPPAPAPDAKKEPAKTALGAGNDDDSIAAMLLSLQDDSEVAAGLAGEVPEGSTVIDIGKT